VFLAASDDPTHRTQQGIFLMPEDSSASQPFCILAISGSLRARSSNKTLLQAMKAVAPTRVTFTIFEGLGDLPHFNPDLDTDDAVPVVVRDFRALVGQMDGLIISSPEYAHGIPGVLKNGLDWLVGSIEFPYKPVALINASARATYAYAALIEVLTTMSAQIIPGASLTIPLPPNSSEASVLADPVLLNLITSALEHLAASRDQVGKE
jgi:chromate reductase, NAD(P)H dehydrogenase (quinone)